VIAVRGATFVRVARSIHWYLRELTGESAYDRYCAHHATAHGVDEPPMSRREFERRRAERSAQPGSRCC
jgi:uncharacterized short protein YbdD (DUF466 family)